MKHTRTTGILLLVLLAAIGVGIMSLPRVSPGSGEAPQPDTNPEGAGAGKVELGTGAIRSTFTRVKVRQSDSASRGSATSEHELPELPAVGTDAIVDEFVLGFYSSEEREAFERLARDAGLEILGRLSCGFMVRVRVDDPTTLRGVLARSPLPVRMERNVRYRSPPPELAPPREGDGTYLAFGAKAAEWMGAPMDRSSFGEGVRVAILDSGVMPHPALDGARVTSVDLLAGTGGEMAQHGTSVASLLVGNGKGVSGICPASELLSIRVVGADGTGDSFTLAAGVYEAIRMGAQVINISMGSRGDSGVLEDAISAATAAGVVVVASTGNDGVDGVLYPARYAGVIAVSAVDASNRHMFFANRGREVDLTAPGLGVAAAGPDDEVVLFSGTLASAPFITGAVAILLSADPGLSPADIGSILARYSDDVGEAGPDEETGSGVLNVERLLLRESKGLNDAAVGTPYLRTEAGGTERIICWAQNRGTEAIGKLVLRIAVNGVVQTVPFFDVGVGSTVQYGIPVPGAGRAGTPVEITCSASMDGQYDVRPANDSIRLLISAE